MDFIELQVLFSPVSFLKLPHLTSIFSHLPLKTLHMPKPPAISTNYSIRQKSPGPKNQAGTLNKYFLFFNIQEA